MEFRMGIVLYAWDIVYWVNFPSYKLQVLRGRENVYQMLKNIAIRTLCKPISKDFAPNTKAGILVAFFIVWPWYKLKEVNVISVIKLLKGEVKFYVEKMLEVLYFPSTFSDKTKNPEQLFLRRFFIILCF